MQKVSFATQNQLMASTCSCFVVLPWPHAPPRRRLHSIVQCRCLSQTDDPCGCRCYSRIRSQSRQPIPTTWQHSLTRTADSTASAIHRRPSTTYGLIPANPYRHIASLQNNAREDAPRCFLGVNSFWSHNFGQS
ncbi:hypothetical protein CABS01_10636 [Colletotrichum abscissum]|uniref:uncharacterized protein n=1 Tax=Colletotrichum abscissum TaxID=1671311 RepID=UPI0027D4B85C|nr:uncharacterized protein CABS01_10636 [Colletotrichum abscissum]KAK1498861.1 hypothetical protein CABS01_10636 [Colletotrichum abscissum]